MLFIVVVIVVVFADVVCFGSERSRWTDSIDALHTWIIGNDVNLNTLTMTTKTNTFDWRRTHCKCTPNRKANHSLFHSDNKTNLHLIAFSFSLQIFRYRAIYGCLKNNLSETGNTIVCYYNRPFIWTTNESEENEKKYSENTMQTGKFFKEKRKRSAQSE